MATLWINTMLLQCQKVKTSIIFILIVYLFGTIVGSYFGIMLEIIFYKKQSR